MALWHSWENQIFLGTLNVAQLLYITTVLIRDGWDCVLLLACYCEAVLSLFQHQAGGCDWMVPNVLGTASELQICRFLFQLGCIFFLFCFQLIWSVAASNPCPASSITWSECLVNDLRGGLELQPDPLSCQRCWMLEHFSWMSNVKKSDETSDISWHQVGTFLFMQNLLTWISAHVLMPRSDIVQSCF